MTILSLIPRTSVTIYCTTKNPYCDRPIDTTETVIVHIWKCYYGRSWVESYFILECVNSMYGCQKINVAILCYVTISSKTALNYICIYIWKKLFSSLHYRIKQKYVSLKHTYKSTIRRFNELFFSITVCVCV